jgi:hypothetical protein
MVLLHLYFLGGGEGGRQGDSRCYATLSVLFKFHFVGSERWKEMSLLCRVEGRLIILWEPFSWDDNNSWSSLYSHDRILLVTLPLKESLV